MLQKEKRGGMQCPTGSSHDAGVLEVWCMWCMEKQGSKCAAGTARAAARSGEMGVLYGVARLVCAAGTRREAGLLQGGGGRLMCCSTLTFQLQSACHRQFVSLSMDVDVVIIDQNLEYTTGDYLGTDVLVKLLEEGFEGLLCVRSANCSETDAQFYISKGAHCVLAKDMLGEQMIQELARAHFLRFGRADVSSSATVEDVSDIPMDDVIPAHAVQAWAEPDSESSNPLPNPLNSLR